jgi:hypothetical protein
MLSIIMIILSPQLISSFAIHTNQILSITHRNKFLVKSNQPHLKIKILCRSAASSIEKRTN